VESLEAFFSFEGISNLKRGVKKLVLFSMRKRMKVSGFIVNAQRQVFVF
jgi:hypothetical protein